MLQVQEPGTCGWPLTGCQAAATFTGASCAARSWRTSGTTITSTFLAGLNVLSVTPRTRVATTCAHTLNSNTPKQERSILTISWPAHWPCPPRITIQWTRSPKGSARRLAPSLDHLRCLDVVHPPVYSPRARVRRAASQKQKQTKKKQKGRYLNQFLMNTKSIYA